MNLSSESATENIDLLIKACNELEVRLVSQYGEKCHDWLFDIREVLYDLRRLNVKLVEACNISDIATAPLVLRSFARSWLHEVIPHIQGHMQELDEDLADLVPDAEQEKE